MTTTAIRKLSRALVVLTSLAVVTTWSLPLASDDPLPGTGICGTPPAPYHHCGRDESGRCEAMTASCSGPIVDSWHRTTRCCWSIGTEWYPIVCYPFTGQWTCCRHTQGGPPRWFPECSPGAPQWGMLCTSDGWCYVP